MNPSLFPLFSVEIMNVHRRPTTSREVSCRVRMPMKPQRISTISSSNSHQAICGGLSIYLGMKTCIVTLRTDTHPLTRGPGSVAVNQNGMESAVQPHPDPARALHQSRGNGRDHGWQIKGPGCDAESGEHVAPPAGH